MNSESTPSNIDHIPLEYFKNLDSNWDAELKSIPDIQQLNNSVQRRDEFEKYAIAAQNEILRLKEVAKYYVNKYKDIKRDLQLYMDYKFGKYVSNGILSKDKGYKGLKEKPSPYIGGSDLNIQTESDDLDN